MSFKTRWVAASRNQKTFVVSCAIISGLSGLLLSMMPPQPLLSTTQPKPLDSAAFLNGCRKTVPKNVPVETVNAYCQRSADGMTPEIVASSHGSKPVATADIRAVAQMCARKVGLAETE